MGNIKKYNTPPKNIKILGRNAAIKYILQFLRKLALSIHDDLSLVMTLVNKLDKSGKKLKNESNIEYDSLIIERIQLNKIKP